MVGKSAPSEAGAAPVMVINSSSGSDHAAPSPSSPVLAPFNINTCNLAFRENSSEGYSNVSVPL